MTTSAYLCMLLCLHFNVLYIFQILLYHKGVNIDAQDRYGMTPLILSSKDCAVTMAKQLLDRQAEPGIADNKGNEQIEVIWVWVSWLTVYL